MLHPLLCLPSRVFSFNPFIQNTRKVTEEGYSLEKLVESIDQLRNKIDVYNTALSVVDSSKTEIEEMEKNLSQLSEKMLMVVAIKYGKDSREYEMAGGVRYSDRIRKIRSSRLKNVAEQASDENTKTA
ncbi:hypothetical protein [Nostoc sp.]|uniref:hypothetical protein n=1 Tax=Nostoc sp. TaxID=1180 RepID=UPI002FFA03FF